MKSNTPKSIAVIVAHPDDETLWAGGTILEHPTNHWFIVCLCRASDTERAAKFRNALKGLKATGIMGDLDDGPDQQPLNEKEVENEILRLLPRIHYDLIMTHDASGEYTKHLRHEEVNNAVINLWHDEKITTNELWTFAYEDGNKAYFPKAIEHANLFESLSEKVWLKKYNLITKTYGFSENSWEAETTPLAEAFWQFKNPHHAMKSIKKSRDDVKVSKLSMFKLLYNDCFAHASETTCTETALNHPTETPLSDKNTAETDRNCFAKVSTQLIEPIVKKSLNILEKELRIFKTQNIETLKLSYYESIGHV